jgi:hypothetical protein
MTTTPPPEPTPRPADQDPDPPDLDLVVRAAQRLRQILNDPDRAVADKRRAIDALGRALLRLKASL